MNAKVITIGCLLISILLSISLPAQNLEQFRGRLGKRPSNSERTVLRNKFFRSQPGQPIETITPEQRTCGTMESEEKLREKYPQMRSLAEEEQLFQEQIEAYRSRLQFRSETEEVITIPVVVHVVHNGEPVGEGANISQAQIQSQIDVLNEDYRRAGGGANDHPAGADTQIQFVLAVEDPQGAPLPEPGIHRINGGRDAWEYDPIQELLKPQTQWDPTRYLNIWTVRFGGGDANLLGYAQFPSLSGLPGFKQNEGPAQTDGVVIRYQSFGRTGNVAPPYNGGRTATHEIGHWLGLRHIWGDGDCSADDFCDDTPPSGQPNYSCVEIQTCAGTERDMVENYMDYTPDGCMSVFTNDQKTRMRTVLMNSPRRKELVNSNAGAGSGNPAGTPVAFFSADKTGACVGENVRFSDQSSNNPTTWEWNFYDVEGNLLGTFNNPTIDITFNDPGLYSVELITGNDAGQDAYFEENFIAVLSDQQYVNLSENFEDLNTALDDWILFNPDADRTFSLSDLSAYDDGAYSIVFDNYSVDDDPSGTVDALVTPAFDLTEAVNPYFYFDHAYATFDTEFSDTLVMFYSLDCGKTFEPFWFKGGEELATAPPTDASFEPAAGEWAGNQVSLAALSGYASVHILIANLSGWGNNLYLDNISFFDGLDLTEDASDPSFYTARTKICEGDLIQFQDYSSNFPSEWLWQFEGGSPASSTAQHPFVSYETAGVYDVGFQSANLLGGDGFTVSDYIEVVPLPNVSLSANVDYICAGEEITLTAGGAERYEWYDQRSGTLIYEGESLTATLYQPVTFIVTGFNELGCERSAVFEVNINPVPETPVITIEGESLTAPQAFAYQWFLEDEPIPEAEGGREQTLQATQTGAYILAVFNDSGCFALSAPVMVVVTAVKDELTDLSHTIRLFPNPTANRLRLEMDHDRQGDVRVEVVNAVGQRVRSCLWEKHGSRLQEEIDLTPLPDGIYYIRVSGDSYRAWKKVVKAGI